METIRGYIEHIIYRNDENAYTVLNLVSDTEDITCVGFFRYADEGENVELTGEYIEHAVYGQQFKVSSYEVKAPEDRLSIIRYLGSGAIKGVGQALATRIVNAFGVDTFRIIEEEPERLSEVKGISMKKAREIAVQTVEKQELRKAMIFLQQYGISDALAIRIYNQYTDDIYRVIRDNPYLLAEDINGIGFKTADEIAAKAGINPDSDFRIKSGLLYVLSAACGEGHCYLPKDELIQRAVDLLGIPEDVVWIQATNLAMEQKLYIKNQEDTIVYSKNFYNMELNCARMLFDLNVVTEDDRNLVETKIDRIAVGEGIELDELQHEAVIKAISNGITIITGGPGTGKTTIINMIIKYFETERMDVLLAAPTGRAAKRMTEATGCEASTIQRMLHLTASAESSDKGFFYEMNEDNPLETDVVIIDEMSMVDLPLFCSLLRAISVGTRIILVGDINQLPSVGPGTVLKDLIASEAFDVVRLKKIFRQARESDIILNAHKINEGEHLTLNNKSRDFFFLKRMSVDLILNNLVKLVNEKLPKYVNAEPYEIQVLTPMRKGNLGVEALNPVLQKYLNPESPNKTEKEFRNVIFREGDKVMQIKNNYQLEWEIKSKYGVPIDKGQGIFNGDTGIIKEIDEYNDKVIVEYDGMRTVAYDAEQLDELELAYAVTIHKAQGTEYPAVIIPILNGPRLLFNRNLLYTGVTRARDCVVLLGDEDMINTMIDNSNEYKRYTGLDVRIKEFNEIRNKSGR